METVQPGTSKITKDVISVDTDNAIQTIYEQLFFHKWNIYGLL